MMPEAGAVRSHGYGGVPTDKASDVKEELEEIKGEHGKITPELVVEKGRSADTALHDVIDWDNEEAARNWRIHQARLIINDIEEWDEATSQWYPAFEHGSPSDEDGEQQEASYHPVADEADNADYAESVLEEQKSRLKGIASNVEKFLERVREDHPYLLDVYTTVQEGKDTGDF